MNASPPPLCDRRFTPATGLFQRDAHHVQGHIARIIPNNCP